MKETIKKTEDKVKKAGFVPDYRYATLGQIVDTTRNHLAKLELELHMLRMLFVASGENPNVTIGNNRRVVDEMDKLKKTISVLETYFVAVLSSTMVR